MLKMCIYLQLPFKVKLNMLVYCQLSQHNKELANLLKPCGDLYGDQALEFYAKHTAQIEVLYCKLVMS